MKNPKYLNEEPKEPTWKEAIAVAIVFSSLISFMLMLALDGVVK